MEKMRSGAPTPVAMDMRRKAARRLTQTDEEGEKPEVPLCPAPRRGEPEHPAPRRGEPELPVPKTEQGMLFLLPPLIQPEYLTPLPTSQQESRWEA
ncbi:UNVERIFIED_CONTAM: hypothetical protein FKN15_050756 [Acipenser sinensis]